MFTRSLTSVRFGVLALALAVIAPTAFGQMQQQQGDMLSSSDVTDEQINKIAKVAVSTQMATRKDRMQMRREMKKKYGNPQQMDSTEKKKARKEIRRKQMEMQKKTQKIMQEEAEKESIEPQMVQKVLQSARQDSTLKKRLQKAMRKEAKKQQPKGMRGGPQGGQKGGSQ